MQSFFTVIIPLYNKELHIQRSIRSILNQSYPYFELLIIDDNSSDSSLEKAKKIKDKRITILKRDKPGPGGYAARNLGIKNAKHSLIAFLDADDEWENDYLLKQLELIKKYPEAGIYSSGYKQQKNKVIKKNKYYNSFHKWPPHLVKKFFILASKGRTPLITSFIITKKEVFEKCGYFPDGKCNKGGDIETWMRIALDYPIAWQPIIGGTYYKDSQNMTTNLERGTTVPYVYFSVNNILKNKNLDKKIIYQLKKYSNYYSNISIIRGLSKGNNIKIMLKNYYNEADHFYYFLFNLLKIIPSNIFKNIYLFRKALKKKQVL